MNEQQPQPTWMNPQTLCWLVAMLLALLTPMALLAGVALWRMLLVLLFELSMLIFLGWLRNGSR